MKCNWCGEGTGINYTKNQDGNIFYYYCKKCFGDIGLTTTRCKLISEFLDFLKNKQYDEWRRVIGENLIAFLKSDMIKEIEKWEKRNHDQNMHYRM